MVRRGPVKTDFFKQVVKFGLVGVLNTGIDALIYYLLTRQIDFFATRQVWAKGISYPAGVVNSFIWNRSWTFRSRANPRRTFAPFFLSNLIGVGINAGVMHLGLYWLALPEALSFIAATGGTLSWNFLVSKFLIFRD